MAVQPQDLTLGLWLNKMEVVLIDVDKLKPYERNNKKHPPEQVEKIARQIKEHGFDVPIVVDADYVIIKGHGRLLACKKLKLKQVPCIVRTDLTPEQVRLARIADNKVSDYGYNLELLSKELFELKALDIDITLTGIQDIDNFFNKDLNEDYNKINDEISTDKELVLVVKFSDELEQEKLYTELIDRGYECKLLA